MIHSLPHTARSILKSFGLGRVNHRDPYQALKHADSISDEALESAKQIRGADRPPAIIIHGVMQRCGTVYTGGLLRMHPEIHAHPNDLWEIPFLGSTGDLLNAQQRFFSNYEKNTEKMGGNDLLPLFGSALIAHLYSFVPEGKTMLLKIPDTSFLSYFPVVFPFEQLLMLLRDGRDVISSTMKTWPERDFSGECERWAKSATLMLKYNTIQQKDCPPYMIAKYEDIRLDPGNFLADALNHFNLNVDEYPLDKIETLPIRGSSTLGKQGEVTWDALTAPKNFNPGGTWTSWSAKQKKTFKSIAGQALLDTGYCENLNW